MVELSNIELLKKYVNYELTEAEERLLEERLQQDEDFKTEFDLTVYLHAKDRVEQRVHYKKIVTEPAQAAEIEVNEIEKATPIIPIDKKEGLNNNRSLINLRWLRIAAILILIPLVSVFVYQNFSKSLDQLVNDEIALMVSNSNNKSVESPKGNLNFKESYDYAGKLLKAGRYEEAIVHYDIVIADSKATNFHNDSEWFKALALIKLNEYEKAKRLLNQLKENDDYRIKTIEALLKKLK